MDTNTLALEKQKIGEVFTPIKWSRWLIKRWNIFDQWVSGKSICDPTAGRGSFAIALFEEAIERQISLKQSHFENLHLIELSQNNLDYFRSYVDNHYSISFPESSLHCCDIITETINKDFDILVGNPPWANFADLPHFYKEKLKQYFIQYGLVPDRKAVLLGSSRTDIAALVIKVAIKTLLKNHGVGYFFVPLSLFSGSEAHTGFRDYRAGEFAFAVDEVLEFNKTAIFDGIGTSYCCASFRKGFEHKFPVAYFRENGNGWSQFEAIPLKSPSDQWRVLKVGAKADIGKIKVTLLSHQKPRQGVNTCGANNVLIFNSYPDFLEKDFVFPLATKHNWRTPDAEPEKWIFLPYDSKTGRPLSLSSLKAIQGYDYLLDYKDKLENRKGTLINAYISKGLWWGMLGVGIYSFAPYKVIWEAYGSREFHPIVLSDFNSQCWQANQAMQAFIPAWSVEDAMRICSELRNPSISRLLAELNGDGKCNFAQPGKVKKILEYDAPVAEQMTLLETPDDYRTRR